MKLKNKVAVVTGSSRGIGKETALLFAKEGAKVVVNYSKSEADAAKVVEEIKKLGSDAIAVKCDVSNENEVEQMFSEVIKKFGKVDILVNNAGVVFDTPFEKKTVSQWETTLKVNLIGTFLCARKAAELMKKQNSCSIINISSTNALTYFNPDSIDYDASKAGVIILTKDLAKALAPKIRVNCVAPGWVNTEMNKDLPKSLLKDEANKIFMKRFAEPIEIANAILFLASDDASYISGSILVVDGGHA